MPINHNVTSNVPIPTPEEKQADALLDYIDEQNGKFDLTAFLKALKDGFTSHAQYVVRNRRDYTPEEYDRWLGLSYEAKRQLR